MTQQTVAVLGFHKIGPPPAGGWESWFYVSEQKFAEFLTDLRKEGWEVVDLGRFLRALEKPDTLPARSALLTFDDGYGSMRDVTLPLLRRFDAPAVLFVPTDYVGRRNTFDAGVEPDEAICDWDDLRELARGGVSIQSHATSHRRFSELSAHEREQEVVRSKATLEEHLGMPCDAIAFPYGDPGPSEEPGMLTRAGYQAAFLYGGNPVRLPVRDRYRLQRVAMGPTTDLHVELGNSLE
jgi:peptidoglycan/xylan/chitin deacetylase (PgdA/CDA1 family)